LRTFCGQGGSLRCGCPHFLMQKTSDFQNLWCVRTEKGGEGVEPVRTFCRQRGVDFSRFCTDVLYGRPLMRVVSTINMSFSRIQQRLSMRSGIVTYYRFYTQWPIMIFLSFKHRALLEELRRSKKTIYFSQPWMNETVTDPVDSSRRMGVKISM